MTTLNVIGAGHVGQTLAHLWVRAGVFSIGGVLNRSLASGQRAAGVIGGGHAVTGFDGLPTAGVVLLTVGDDAIKTVANALGDSRDLRGSVVLHCSGSLPSTALGGAKRAGATVASVHPVKSFADVAASAASFEGTFCGYEGDDGALAIALPAFEAIGGRMFAIDAAGKALYHAGVVFAMNYFVAAVEAGLSCYEQAGVERGLALQILEPLLHGAVTNITHLGTTDALTGPIARGDVDVVRRQLEALHEWNPELESLYAGLGRQALALSRQAGKAPRPKLDELGDVLNGSGAD